MKKQLTASNEAGAAAPAKKPIRYVSKARKAEAASTANRRPISYKAKTQRVKPLFIQISDLTFHPLLKRVGLQPSLIVRETEKGKEQGKARAKHKANAEEMGHDFEALVQSVGTHGIREKLKVVKDGKGGWLIVDGRHRYEAAAEVLRRWVLAETETENAVAEQLSSAGLPCEEVAEGEVVPIILDAVNRRHLSKGARAYMAVLMLPEIAREAKRGGDQAKRIESALLTGEDLAVKAGVSPRLIDDAVSLYRQFEARPDVRNKFEDAIWVGAGLANLLAGIKGYLKTGQEPDEEEETEAEAKARIAQGRIETAMQKWVGVTTAFKHWETIPKASREPVIKTGVETVMALPEEVRKAISDALLGREF